jgi:hypothetical protein
MYKRISEEKRKTAKAMLRAGRLALRHTKKEGLFKEEWSYFFVTQY